MGTMAVASAINLRHQPHSIDVDSGVALHVQYQHILF